MDEFKITSEGLFYSTSKNGVESNFYKAGYQESNAIVLPKKAGKIVLTSKSVNLPEIWLNLSGWISSDERYFYSVSDGKFNREELAIKANYIEYENFIVDEILISSYDGVLVPLSIIYNSKIEKNNNTPTLFYGYGAYGDAISPFFSPLFLTWVENGGILCIPHVRGGGEKGEEWHKGGFKNTKPNTWKDLIACAEYMIKEKYTNPEKIILYSNSAGGIMVGGAITERPKLFKATIIDVGVLNPLRRSLFR